MRDTTPRVCHSPLHCYRTTANVYRLANMAELIGIKIIFCVCAFVIGTVIWSSFYLDSSSLRARVMTVVDQSMLYLPQSGKSSGQNNQNGSKTILIITWTNRHPPHKPWFKEGTTVFEKCDLPKGVMCEYRHDRSLYDKADAVVFKSDRISQKDMPLTRRKDQLWVFHERETFQHRPGKNWLSIANIFNITSSYSTQADLTSPYGKCQPKASKSNETIKVRNYAENKTHLVAWFVSNCKPANRRQEYVTELKKHIQVDIYGKCGNMTCSGKTCVSSVLEAKYKFYLAFENSFCGEYVTEKFYRTLGTYVVPVVLGIADYKKLAPPHSYIDIRDFRSPKELAKYLLMLDKKDDLYNEYFRWKPNYDCAVVPYFSPPEVCGLCSIVHKRMNSPPNIPFNVSRMYQGSAACEPVDRFKKNCDCWPHK